MMTADRRLLLLRHAQAASTPGLEDAQRPLTEQGEQDAADVGRWLHASGITPGLVLCSTARRARRTWELGGAALQTTPPVSYEKRIYEAEDDAELVAPVREVDERVGCLAVVGHNPTIRDLAASLTGPSEVRDRFPAGSLAVVDVAGGWAQISSGAAALAAFVPPVRTR